MECVPRNHESEAKLRTKERRGVAAPGSQGSAAAPEGLEAGLREPVLPGKQEAASLRDQNVLGPLLLCVLIIISGEELISK